jgi:hypothetical protein
MQKMEGFNMAKELIRTNKNKSIDAEINPLVFTGKEKEKPKNDFRRNLKLTDPIFFKIRALTKIKSCKQYELIDKMADLFVDQLTEQERQLYEYQLEAVMKNEGIN